MKHFPELEDTALIKIKAGEKNKHLKTCQEVWQQLSDLGADRKSLLIGKQIRLLVDSSIAVLRHYTA